MEMAHKTPLLRQKFTRSAVHHSCSPFCHCAWLWLCESRPRETPYNTVQVQLPCLTSTMYPCVSVCVCLWDCLFVCLCVLCHRHPQSLPKAMHNKLSFLSCQERKLQTMANSLHRKLNKEIKYGSCSPSRAQRTSPQRVYYKQWMGKK